MLDLDVQVETALAAVVLAALHIRTLYLIITHQFFRVYRLLCNPSRFPSRCAACASSACAIYPCDAPPRRLALSLPPLASAAATTSATAAASAAATASSGARTCADTLTVKESDNVHSSLQGYKSF